MIPAFEASGLLPAGVHATTWGHVEAAFGQGTHRTRLLLGLRDACHALAQAGCTTLWLDGSFVTTKRRPNDYDACWDWVGVDHNLLDPLLTDYSPAGRAAMKGKYLGDIFIAGIEAGSGIPFVEFFSRTRDNEPKGIVRINPQETP